MKTINADQLKHMFDEGEQFTLINTLPAEWFSKTHIPHSINIPEEEDDFVDQVMEVAGEKSHPIVVYCASAKCDSSAKAATKLETAGFTNIMKFDGGAEEWQAKGEKLEEAAV